MQDTSFLSQRFGSQWRYTDSSRQYAVSQDGRMWRASYAPHKTTTGHKDALGFHAVNLSKGLELAGRWYLHRLVYTIWVKPLAQGYDVIHQDANKSNNAVHNLLCVEHVKTLERSTLKKQALNQTRIEAIKVLLQHGWTQEKIAEAFEVSQPAISSVFKTPQR